MWVQSPGGEGPLEKGMATHSSVLPWESHGQRSLMGYSPLGHRVGHNGSNLACTSTPYPRSIYAILRFHSFFMAEWYSSVCVCMYIPYTQYSIVYIQYIHHTAYIYYRYIYTYTCICIYILLHIYTTCILYVYTHTHRMHTCIHCVLCIVWFFIIRLILPVHEHCISFHLFVLSLVSFIKSYSFLSTDCLPPCLYLL